MASKIQRLPELLANQIAAGEVVGSPSSVVKELVENSVDAGCSYVIISIKEGGKSSIQIIDDGSGIDSDEVETAFERHATSKIAQFDDLLNISTYGFRGEALASIASVAEVELITRTENDELATKISINGGSLVSKELVNGTKGSQMSVRNLFYNIPARRKSLKNDASETKKVIAEFQRIALSYPKIAFSLYVDEKPVFILNSSNLKQRVAAVMGKNIGNSLMELYVDTSVVEVKGYIGSPDMARKRTDSFFFVNGRYFESPYLYKAVSSGYKNLVQEGQLPPFFLYLKADPATIDVNVSPTKTSIKFDDESAVWQIINATVRECLGKNGIVPMIDFESGPSIDIPVEGETPTYFSANSRVSALKSYNPFDESFSFSAAVEGDADSFRDNMIFEYSENEMQLTSNNEYLKEEINIENESISYKDVDSDSFSIDSMTEVEFSDVEYTEVDSSSLFEDQEVEIDTVIKIGDRHVVSAINGNLYVFDIARIDRVLVYNTIKKQLEGTYSPASQKLLFPVEVSLSVSDRNHIEACYSELVKIGFDMEFNDGEDSNVIINGIPAIGDISDTQWYIEEILSEVRFEDISILSKSITDRIASSLTRAMNRRKQNYNSEEIKSRIKQLFKLDFYNYTHEGKKVFVIINGDEIAQLFK